MSSRSLVELLIKEWRELLASRAFWLLLLMIGPLVGHSFLSAVALYAEASGIGGAPAALPQGLTPLDGMLVPTFGAYDLAAMFLFPLVAVRSVAAEKQSGGLKLLLQFPASLNTKIAIKGIVLFIGWFISLLPGILALVIWKSYGGHLYGPETLNLLLGYLLRTLLSVGIALPAAALAESGASAAIVILGFTVSTWALDFIAAYRGGFLQQLAAYTPTATLRSFEQGLLRLNSLIVMLAISVAGFAMAAIWLHTGRSLRFRSLQSAAVALILAVVLITATNVRASWDLSENRRNSFSRTDEATLKQIHQPLHVEVFLAAEDPRLNDLEQNVLKKLRRILPQVDVDYSASSRTGLFEGAEDHYGEVWYEAGGQRVMERSTIEPVVLEQIYKLTSIAPPESKDDDEFPGYPLAVQPRRTAWFFYGCWPLITVFVWWLIRH